MERIGVSLLELLASVVCAFTGRMFLRFGLDKWERPLERIVYLLVALYAFFASAFALFAFTVFCGILKLE